MSFLCCNFRGHIQGSCELSSNGRSNTMDCCRDPISLDRVPFVMTQIAVSGDPLHNWKVSEEKTGLFSFLGVSMTAWQPKLLSGMLVNFALYWTLSRQILTSVWSKLMFCEHYFTASHATTICSWLRHNWPACLMSVNMCAPFHSLTPSEPWPDEMFSHKARLHRWMGCGRLRWVWLTLGSCGHNGGRSF